MTTRTWMLCALASLVIIAQAKDAVVEVYYRQTLTLSMNYTMMPGDSCFVLSPTSTQFLRLHPIKKGHETKGRVQYIGQESKLYRPQSFGECGFKVDVVDASLDAGIWRLIVENDGENFTEEFVVRVVEPTQNVIPKGTVKIVEGQNLFLRFEQNSVSDLVECRVNWTSGRDVVLRPGYIDDPLVRYWGSGLKEECGVQAVNIAVEDGGDWTLQALDSTGHVMQGDFYVQVINETTYVDGEQTIIDKKFETIDLGASDSKYCQSMRPNGKTDDLQSKPCSVVLNSASKGDGGVWSAKFAVVGQVQEVEVSKSVQVIDMETMETSLSESSRLPGALDLLCLWTTYEYARIQTNFCRLIRPDGVAFSLEDGVGGVDYSYYGEGVNYSDNEKYCGVTIHAPAQRDVGIWQCVIGVSLGQLTKGGFIEVPAEKVRGGIGNNNSNSIIILSGGDDVFVEMNTTFTIGCQATVSLNYCWFTHPNKKMVTPTMSRNAGASRDAVYSGRGLGLGDCAMRVSEAEMADEGTWICNMGVAGQPDLSVPINVIVTDSSIVAESSEVLVKDGTAIINCHSSPLGVSLQYCRFVRPDGFGFGFTTNFSDIMDRYHYNGAGLEKGECGLKIVDFTTVDIGYWTCAGLPVTSKQEGQAEVYVIERQSLGGAAIAGIAIACIIAVTLTTGVIYSRFSKSSTD